MPSLKDLLNGSESESDSEENNTGPIKRRKLMGRIESYHGSVIKSARQQIQKDFMSGSVRIVVATIAFGMGLNKRDVRAIIHYNMPKSFESLVQEMGRAGRDGNPAYCHVFINEV